MKKVFFWISFITGALMTGIRLAEIAIEVYIRSKTSERAAALLRT